MFWIPARARFAGLGRDDELRHSLGAGGLNSPLLAGKGKSTSVLLTVYLQPGAEPRFVWQEIIEG